MYKRSIDLEKIKTSFFLWGPRQVGKTSLLKTAFPGAIWFDLLQSEVYVKMQTKPSLLREELAILKPSGKTWIVIDEVQKVPALLDEVHWLIENRGLKFVLCGSSARKLKRGHANLLGGRALRRELLGLSATELGADFEITKFINCGYIPNHFIHDDFKDRLRSYCTDYLKEEIFAEGLVRNLPAFSRFLNVASFSDAEQVEFTNIARDVGVSSPTIKSYFEILEDTLIGQFISVYRKRPKRRIQGSPKFYFFDVGVVNSLSNRGTIEPKSELFGKAFENWVFHELQCLKAYQMPDLEISYWGLSTGTEVDFILNDMECAIEVKSSGQINDSHLKGLRELKNEHPKVKRRIVVSSEEKSRETDDGIQVLSVPDFVKELSENSLV